MMNFEITPEMIEQLPADQRGPWEEQLAQRERFAEHLVELEAEGKWDELLMLTGSEGRAAVLIRAGKVVDDDQLRSLLSDYWSVTEAWSGDASLRDPLITLLRRVAPLSVPADDSDPDDVLPEGTLTLWRGNLGEPPTHGHSWSLDRETAERFARMAAGPRGWFLGMNREGGVPSIWRARADSEHVLGYFNDRQEREIVIDPEWVRDVELVAQAVAKGEA